MNNRQRSFFDQDHGVKARPQWQRNKGNSDTSRDRNDRNTSKELVDIPQVALSTQTKSKLKAFEFIAPSDTRKPPAAGSGHVDKENSNFPHDPTTEDAVEESERGPLQPPSTQESVKPLTKDCPRTPAPRLPLADLIGTNGEDAPQRDTIQEISPERVFWKHITPGSVPQSIATPSHFLQRGKRARSSSPPSSPYAMSELKPERQSLQKNPRTPQADPAMELWNRYSMSTANKSTAKLPPDFTHLLINGSSPHPPGARTSPGSVLRRSLSCGMEWPTSKVKRRRTAGPGADSSDDVFFALAEDTQETPARSKLSRVSLLVDKLQESLSHPTRMTNQNGPSSSSPLPLNGDLPMLDNSSPLRRASGDTWEGRPSVALRLEESLPSERDLTIDQNVRVQENSSSEFGDFDDADIDMDMLNAVESAAVTTAVTAPQRKVEKETSQNDPVHQPALTRADSDAIAKDVRKVLDAQAGGVITNGDMALDGFDEFDGSDEEIFAADLEDIVAMYDTQRPPNPREEAGAQVEPMRDVGISPQPMARVNEPHVDMSDGEFGELDDVDFEGLLASEPVVTQPPKEKGLSQTPSNRKAKVIKRYLVKDVVLGRYELSPGQLRPERVLRVRDEKAKTDRVVILRQSWFDTPCTPGSFIHLIGDFTHDGQCIIDDAHNMLILHPDHLISATVVADSFTCPRRAVLQDRVKATGESSPPVVFGHILHEVFQEAMAANKWDSEALRGLIERVVSRHMEDIYNIQMEAMDAISYLTSRMPAVQAWAELFVVPNPQAGATISDRNGATATMCVNKLLDVEEHVWSPMYGLKGNIDASVQVTMVDNTKRKTLTVPFELKTGKNTKNAMHRAQTALYTLLLSDRYDVEIAYGILYYMETSETHRIHAIRHELRHMVMQRNELACYVRDRLQLPPMLKSPHMCGNCYAKTSCFIYHKLLDDGNGETSGLKDKFDEQVRHLKPKHKEFFVHWDDLLTKEEKDMLKFRRELWTMTSAEREKLGRCFGNVVIEPSSAYEAQDGSKINRYWYTFVKSNPVPGFSFVQSQIAIGEPIVISDEEGHFALANGYVTQVSRRRITVAVDRRLHNSRVQLPGFDAEENQIFSGIMEVTEDGQSVLTPLTRSSDDQVLYRLDKDEFSNGMATARNNLIHIMSDGPFGSGRLRELIVDGRRPTFKPTSTAYSISSQAELNVDQKNAIEKVMSAQDYALVLGMPGTGKTTTIAHIIRALVSQGKDVLLTSYTHTAVDNILLKIIHDDIGILRLGAATKVHPEVQEFATLAALPRETIAEVQDAYHSPRVVATTCLGINHPIFNERIFDYCIVDEASQLTLPVCLGPIRMAKTFILVGDHYQLPPLVRNEEAKEGGLDISLFRLLSEMHPESVANLAHQYRMCEDIMTLSNTLIYDGRLRCGTEEVARRSLNVPNMDGLKLHHYNLNGLFPAVSHSICLGPQRNACWLRDALDPSLKVCFINTDPLLPASREQTSGSRTVNPTEAALCTQLVSALLATGVPASSIGVISVYRSQIALLRHSMRNPTATHIEMHTADKFQGRDKDVVILSLVRSNEAKSVGELLKDWRRINVSLTRARTKLLVVGSAETMGGDGLLGKFLDIVRELKGGMMDLPKGALGIHSFEQLGEMQAQTQTQGQVEALSQGHVNCGSGSGVKIYVDIEDEGIENVGIGAKVKPSPKAKTGRGRAPEKVGRVIGRERAVLGSRPVLRDIVNDLS
ncbi:MAG: Tripartite DNA replication factor [Geoglossum umbratile]|nr:MAG: Tripartite DNA replication factor [Geoglossum umbratile]